MSGLLKLVLRTIRSQNVLFKRFMAAAFAALNAEHAMFAENSTLML